MEIKRKCKHSRQCVILNLKTCSTFFLLYQIKEEKTPLHVAAEKGYTQIVETLIDKFGSVI